MFPELRVEHLVHSFSDHCPIFVNTNKEKRERIINLNSKPSGSWKTHLLMKLSVYGG